jgi:prepilin-type processing-associated H-X9-DG protein
MREHCLRGKAMWLVLAAAGLLAPVIAHADPLTGSIYRDSGLQWWLVVTALITLIEWPIFALTAKYSWALSLPIVALANVASGLLGISFGARYLLSVLPGFMLEWLVAYGFVCGLSRVRVRAPWSVFVPVVLMNLATFWIAPSLSMKLPPSDDQTGCMSNMHRIGEAVEKYTVKHDRMTHLTSLQELRGTLGESLDERSYHCLGREGLQLVVPMSEKTAFTLLLPWPDKTAEGVAATRVLLACPQPVHNGGRNCLYADGHVKWLAEDRFQRTVNAPDHIDSR